MKNLRKVIYLTGILLINTFSAIQAQVWNCGYPNAEDITATLRNDTLFVCGTEEMADFTIDDSALNEQWRDPEYSNSIRTIVIQNDITNIGSYAFINCENINSVVVPESVISIGDWAFIYCSRLDSISVHNNLKKVGMNAFYGTKWYENQPNGAVYIGNILLRYKGEMVSTRQYAVIDNPDGSWGLEGYTPRNDTLYIREGTTIIAANAFLRNYDIGAVFIPNSVRIIEQGAFRECFNLRLVRFGEGVEEIEEAAFSAIGIRDTLVLGNKIKSIGNVAFFQTPITSVVFGDSIKSIGHTAFYGCKNLISVTIGSNVTDIGEEAFHSCNRLSSVINRNSIPQRLVERTFWGAERNISYSITQHITLRVPASSVSDYKNAEVWKEFGMIVGLDE